MVSSVVLSSSLTGLRDCPILEFGTDTFEGPLRCKSVHPVLLRGKQRTPELQPDCLHLCSPWEKGKDGEFMSVKNTHQGGPLYLLSLLFLMVDLEGWQ